MRNLILMVLFFSVSSMFGQHLKGLKSPEAKNYKPWKNTSKSSALLVTKTPKKLRSPSVKNFKPWKVEKKVKVAAVTFGSKKNKLRSPEAKNYKPWVHRKRE